MSRAWLLPEQIADVLPSQARRVEELRRTLIDRARGYGYELVMPPLVEHLDSLLSGTGQELGLKTFKLVDQLSGRTIGLRADTTPQVARIDAHLLNREGVARLAYCGPVLHARADSALASRELLQFGAEVYGHAGLEADLEVIDLALDSLASAGIGSLMLDLGDARVLRARLDGAALDAARSALPQREPIRRALDDLAWLAQHVQRAHPAVRIGFDLADLSGYAYYSGPRFSLDVKELAAAALSNAPHAAVRAPWGEAPALRAAVRRLREEGHTVVCTLPGHEQEAQEYDCDRELAEVDGRWVLRAL